MTNSCMNFSESLEAKISCFIKEKAVESGKNGYLISKTEKEIGDIISLNSQAVQGLDSHYFVLEVEHAVAYHLSELAEKEGLIVKEDRFFLPEFITSFEEALLVLKNDMHHTGVQEKMWDKCLEFSATTDDIEKLLMHMPPDDKRYRQLIHKSIELPTTLIKLSHVFFDIKRDSEEERLLFEKALRIADNCYDMLIFSSLYVSESKFWSKTFFMKALELATTAGDIRGIRRDTVFFSKAWWQTWKKSVLLLLCRN